MKKFYRRIIEFAGGRTDRIDTSLYVTCQLKKLHALGLNPDEANVTKQTILKEASYLRGFMDGIRLAKIIKKSGPEIER